MNDPKPQGIRHPWRFKAKVALKDSLKKILNRWGVNVARYPKVFLKHPHSCFEITFEWLLNYYWLTKKEAFFFVQIGANDGLGDDPIHHFIKTRHPRGILVEPQPSCVEALKKTYQDEPQLIIEPCLIGNKEGVLPFYTSCYSKQTTLLASLDYDIILKSLKDWKVPNPKKHIQEMQVPVCTLSQLMAKHKVEHLDLLQIDTEGYDFEIIKTIDFKKFKPAIIAYEHRHLSELDKMACWDLLVQEGYMLWVKGPDTVAIIVDNHCLEDIQRII